MYTYESSYETPENQMEVVEWLKWYRYAINDIISKKRIMDESHEATYFDVLQNDFYSAVNAAYYGPLIQSLDFLPNCFEADVRSVPGTLEILHLVSGRDLFGKVCIAKTVLELSHSRYRDSRTQITTYDDHKDQICDAYKDLELHVSGKIVAVAKRVPPKDCTADVSNEEGDDHIHVYLNLHDDCKDAFEEDASENKMFLGSIIGLGTSGEEGSCFVYNNCGVKTHTVMIHRTLLVKHMHWYQLGDKVSVCECRCTRARLPPSKTYSILFSRFNFLMIRYWLFEPRCGLHDIGGWYVETYGKDNKGKTVLSQRYWDGVDFSQPSERRVHPAMYLLALAYRTLDIEDTKRNKQTVRDIVEGKMSEVYNWYKKHM
ncbi:uncharacterized protein LOC143596699 isoform X1 [Bidens hawaiensis]|uniref:uncharacterized protein LOC143596699 isoform X1 n=1 Tax=Bidens hawaiensis TaxID=980011 RepID=UPI0040499BCC